MKVFSATTVVFILCLLLSTVTASAEEILTNRSVERMVAAGLSPEIITSKIKGTKSNFDVSIDEILELKKKGINDDIIKAMVEAGSKNLAPPQNDYDHDGQYYEPGSGQQYEPNSSYRPHRKSDPIAKLMRDIGEAQALKDKRDYTWKGKAHAIGATLKGIYPSNTHNIKYWWAYTQYSVLVGKEHHILKGIKKVLYFDPYHQEALILKGDTNFIAATKGHTRTKSRGRKRTHSTANKAELAWVAEKAYKTALELPKISPEKKARVYFQLGEMADQVTKSKEKARQNWQKAVEEAPNSTWADKARVRLGG